MTIRVWSLERREILRKVEGGRKVRQFRGFSVRTRRRRLEDRKGRLVRGLGEGGKRVKC